MNRQKKLLRRATRAGVYVMRLDGSKKYDVVDQCGPCGFVLTRRQAIILAASAKKHKFRMYGTTLDGSWHRWNCEVVAAPCVASKPCSCKYLKV